MNEETRSKPEGIDWPLERWANWVAERVKVRERTFENEPSEMIAAYNRELRSTQDYHGREILELLQNADDAGIGFGSNKALVHLSAEGVCMANTGVPFSTAGIQSLMISDRSPKQLDRTRYIGNRGLGFRSILSWTDCPFIFSGFLRLGFSTSFVAARLKILCTKNVRLRNEVEEMRQKGYQNPIPILACPAILEENGAAESLWQPSANYKVIWGIASTIRAEGYGTVIAIPFTEVDAYKEVSAQIIELSQELMLFLQNLEELVIRTESGSRVWRVKREREEVHVVTEGDATRPACCWRVFTRQGKVPDDHLEKHQRAIPGFEIKIAVPLQGEQTGMLFNYFPTKVRFPYPVVAHATMDLTSNRQNLVDTKANRYLVGQLAETLAEAAEAALVPGDLWRPLKSLAKRGNLDPILEQFGFGKALLAAARTKRLIPERNGEVVQASSVKWLPMNPEGWLPKEEFADLALWTDDNFLRGALIDLGVKQLDLGDLRERLNRLSPTLSIADRAALLAGFLRQGKGFMPQNPLPRLLIDDDKNLIEPETAAYLPPTTPYSFRPPEWMPLRFVSRELIEALQAILRVSREILVGELRAFNLHAYDFGGLASAIVARINDRCREEGADEASVRLQGFHVLKGLYESSSNDEVPKRRQELRVRLPTRTGEWAYADGLYLGKDYPNGNLMEALLGTLHPEQFVADPVALGLEENTAGCERFLCWLGVSVLPREKTLQLSPYSAQGYVEYVRRSLQYPAHFDECVAKEPEKLHLTSLENLTSIEHIKEILEKADPHAILAWVAIDPRIENWRVSGDTSAKLEAQFHVRTMRKLTDQALPSYVLWLLREQDWLPVVTDGHREAPSRCVRARVISEEIRQIFPQPAVRVEYPLLKSLKVDQGRLMIALGRVGVYMTLEDLTWEQCYKALLKLPHIDPNGAAALSFYRLLAGKEEDTETDTLALRKQFQEQGRLWCRLGGKWSYRSIRDGIYFVADPTIPKAVEDIFPILDLSKGRGTDKIQRVFGVQILRATDVYRQVNNHIPLPRNELLNDEVSRLKPFILALRLDSNPDATGSARLKNLKIVACSNVQAVARVREREIPFHLNAHDDTLICEDVAYLVIDRIDEEHPLRDPIIADRVANIMAAVLQVERASDFARLAVASHGVRPELLSRILQHDGSGVLQRARETLELPDEKEDIADYTRADDFQTSESRQENYDTTSGSRSTDTSLQKPFPNRVTSKQFSHTPTKPTRRVSLRVQSSKRCPPDHIRRTRRVTNGNRCEELAQLFEKEQGRCPLLVSAIQGELGFGCDLLSFATEIDRERFIVEADTSCIQRFIEVKGRGSQSGGIQLERNQLRAARNHRDKYFIYRVYEAVTGQEWHVVVLQNPLAYEWPISYSIDPLQRSEAECWSVVATNTDSENGQSPTEDKPLDTVEEKPLAGRW